MKTTSCLTISQVEKLQKQYKLGDISLLSDLKDISNLNEFIQSIPSLNELKKDKQKFNEFEKSVKDAAQLKSRFYVLFKTGFEDKDLIRGFTWSDLDDIANTTSSGLISLFNIENLDKLMKNGSPLQNFFSGFLFEKDEDGEFLFGPNGNLIPTKYNSALYKIKSKFRNSKVPYGDLTNDDTFQFYVKQVIPFIEQFLRNYYENYYNEEIFEPQFQSAKEKSGDRSVIDLIKSDPSFAELSKNKDMIVGTIISLMDFIKKANEVSQVNFQESVREIEEFKVVEKLLNSLDLRDPSFSSLISLESGDEEEEEFQATDENVTRSFEASGNEKSAFESASSDTRSVLSSLFGVEGKKLITDKYGMPKLINGYTAFKQLSGILRGIFDYTEFYNKLSDEKTLKEYPYIQQLLDNHLIDPNDSDAIEDFLNSERYTKNRKQRIRQSLLQDLSKDEVVAKEINLEAKKPKGAKSIETQTLSINNARLKKAALIFTDSISRFFNTYVAKNDYLRQPLVNEDGYIRIRAFYAAKQVYDRVSKQIKENQKDEKTLKDIKNVLAVLGIVFSPRVKDAAIFNFFKRFSGNKSELEKFFNEFKFDGPFGEAVKEVSKQDIIKIGKDINLNINSILFDFKNLQNTEENLEDLSNRLIRDSKILNQISLKSLKSREFKKLENTYIKNLLKEIQKVKGKIGSHEDYVKKLTRELQAELTILYDKYIDDEASAEIKKQFLNKIEKVKNPIIDLKDKSVTKLNNLYESFAIIEDEYNIQYNDDMIIDYNGKSRSQIQQTNNLILKANDLNSKDGSRQIFNRFPELDPRRNPAITGSIIFNQLFDMQPDGTITKSSSTSQIEVNSVLGVKLKGNHLQALQTSITDLNLGDNELASIFSLLFNGNEESFNVDKSSVFNLRFSRFDRSYLGEKAKENTSRVDEFLPVPVSVISELYKKQYVNYKTADKELKQMLNIKQSDDAESKVKPIANIFAKYLSSYLLTYYEIESPNGTMNYVKNNYENLGKKYQELGMFEKDSSKTSGNDYIISKVLKDKLKEKVLKLKFTEDTTLQEKIDAITAIVKGTNFQEFQSTLLQYFNTQVEKIFNDIPYTKNLTELQNLINLFQKEDSSGNKILPYYDAFTKNLEVITGKEQKVGDKQLLLNYSDMFKAILMTYVVNSNILIHEKMTLFFGESMFVKDYAKRANAAGSAGNYNLIDDLDIKIYNDPKNKEAFAFAKAFNERLIKEGKPGLNMDLHKLDYTFRFGQVKDNYVFSQLVYDNLKKGYLESFKKKFKNNYKNEKALNKAAEEEANKSLEAYTDLNEADGFGVITFDWYRILSKQTKTWSDEQEKLYMEIINGGNVSPAVIAVTFPVRKFSYIGSVFLNKTDLPADATHKYSLAPLIPGSGDNNLKTKHENLVKEGKVYEIFKSASKRETIGTNINRGGLKDSFYDGDPKLRIIEPIEDDGNGNYVSGKDVLYGMTMLIRDQVHVDPEIKTKVILARQLKRIIKTDLYNGGVPTDYTGTRKWEELTEDEQREASNIHAIYRGIMDSIKEINTIELQNILSELGVKATKNKKGELTYELKDPKKVLQIVSKEVANRARMQKSDSSSVLSDLLRTESRKNESDIEAFVNLSNLKSIFKNILDKNIRLRKMNGSHLVQAPITGNEPINNSKSSITISKKNIYEDRNGYLKFYESNGDKTSKAEIMITFHDKWRHLLDLEYEDETIDDLDTLNKALLDENWRKLHEDKLTVLAVRIPIQDPNSIEGFVIKQFLPKSAGSKIVVPSEIVAKSGGDFDIDKLMVYYYNVDKETGQIPFDDSIMGHENKIIKGYLDLLLLPEMFYKLITANSVTVLKKKEKKDVDKIVDFLAEAMGDDPLKYDGTDLRTARFNAIQKTNLQEAKKLLGHAASSRAFFEELKHSNFITSPTVKFNPIRALTYFEKSLIDKLGLNITVERQDPISAPIRIPFIMDDGSLAYNEADVIDEEGKIGKGISLSQIFNKKGTQISELISATMNGFVDVGKEPWITALKMNSKLTSLNYMMIEGGVPEDMIFLFNNQKIVRDYILNQIALEESPFKRLLNPNRSTYNSRVIMDTIDLILNSLQTKKEKEEGTSKEKDENQAIEFRRELTKETKEKLIEALKLAGLKSPELVNYINLYNYDPSGRNNDLKAGAKINLRLEIETQLLNNFASLKQDSFLKEKDLKISLKKDYLEMSEQELANQFKLLSFLPFLQNYSGNLVTLMQAEDFDRSKSQYISAEYKNQENIKKIKSQRAFPKSVMERFERLNVSADYNISKLTMDVAAMLFPITENKIINRYALKIGNAFKEYLVKDKEDAFVNNFKTDFINFVVQNYGKVKIQNPDGTESSKNIVEYLVDESVFVNKNTGKKALSLSTLENQSVSTKLYTLISNFQLFQSLEVFNYLITTQVRKKAEKGEEDLETEFVYKLGRMFKNLNPLELKEFNKDTETFAKLKLKMVDILQAIETTNGEVLNDFDISLNVTKVKDGKEEVIVKSTEEIIEELEKLKGENENYLKISPKKINPDTLVILNRLLDKATDIKNFVATTLPYISIVQSSSTYSTNFISNLFVRKNYRITLDAIKEFKKKETEGVTKELLNEYLIQFILNNINYIRKDKQSNILKLIAGEEFNKETQKMEPVKFSSSKAITASNYFNNYYKKEYSIFEDNDFESAPLISDSVVGREGERGFFSSIMVKKADKAAEEAEEIDDTIDIGINVATAEDEDDILIGEFNLKGTGIFRITKDKEVLTSKDELVTDPILKNKVLVNYFSTVGGLKTVKYKNKPHYVVENNIINSKFEDVGVEPKELVDLLLAATPHQLNCKQQ